MARRNPAGRHVRRRHTARRNRGHIPSAWLMVVPIVVMILMMPIGLYVTGDGSLIEGSGSTAILWSVSTRNPGCLDHAARQRRHVDQRADARIHEGRGQPAADCDDPAACAGAGRRGQPARHRTVCCRCCRRRVPAIHAGTADLPRVRVHRVFGWLELGHVCHHDSDRNPDRNDAGTARPLLLGAAISGAIFGDHASPISDTTVVASMASATDHIDHVRTQLPYALVAAGIATIGFLLLSVT